MKITPPKLLQKKKSGEPIVALTAYDATFAALIDAAEVDMVLVGDSLGMVIQGQETTLPVTLEDVLYHTRAVRRGVKSAQIIADMPFLSYQVSRETAILNAGRLIKEGGAEAVKLEGGKSIAPIVHTLSEIGIPVMGHVGLEPQQVLNYGGYKRQGTNEAHAAEILEDACAIAEAGAYAIVLEGIPSALAKEITGKIAIPTIGIGSGPHCDGQILVSYDIFGLNPNFSPKFVKRYCDGYKVFSDAAKSFAKEVRNRKFPLGD